MHIYKDVLQNKSYFPAFVYNSLLSSNYPPMPISDANHTEADT